MDVMQLKSLAMRPDESPGEAWRFDPLDLLAGLELAPDACQAREIEALPDVGQTADQSTKSQRAQPEPLSDPEATAGRIAKESGVSVSTVKRGEHFSKAVNALGEATKAIARVATTGDAKDITDRAAAIKVFAAKQGWSTEQRAEISEIQIRATARLGELLKETLADKGRPKINVPDDDILRLSDLGISKKQSSRAQQIASVPEHEREKYIAENKSLALAKAAIAELRQKTGKRATDDLREIFPEGSRAKDDAAAEVGMSRPTAEKAAAVVDEIDQATEAEPDVGPSADRPDVAELARIWETALAEFHFTGAPAVVPFACIVFPARGWHFAALTALESLGPDIRNAITSAAVNGSNAVFALADGTVSGGQHDEFWIEPAPEATEWPDELIDAERQAFYSSDEPDSEIMNSVSRCTNYSPSPSEIAAGAALVRAGWSDEQRRKASGREKRQLSRTWVIGNQQDRSIEGRWGDD